MRHRTRPVGITTSNGAQETALAVRQPQTGAEAVDSRARRVHQRLGRRGPLAGPERLPTQPIYPPDGYAARLKTRDR